MLLPRQVTRWSKNAESFSISRLPDGASLSAAQLAQAMASQAAALGTVSGTQSLKVCGATAERVVVDNADTGSEIAEQIEVVGTSPYVLTYSHPRNAPADAGIDRVLDSYCGDATPALAPPAGWAASDGRLLGIWFGSGSQSVTAFVSGHEADAMSQATGMMASSIKASNVVIESHHAGTLCGLPALFFEASATPGGQARIDLTFEFTQSATAAYTVVYSRPHAQPVDRAATASLATLCAAGPRLLTRTR